MSVKNVIQLKNKTNSIIKKNNAGQITAVLDNDLRKDVIDSFLNLMDGGLLIQSIAGYSSAIDLTSADKRAFASLQYVDDMIGDIDLSEYIRLDGSSAQTTGNIKLGGLKGVAWGSGANAFIIGQDLTDQTSISMLANDSLTDIGTSFDLYTNESTIGFYDTATPSNNTRLSINQEGILIATEGDAMPGITLKSSSTITGKYATFQDSDGTVAYLSDIVDAGNGYIKIDGTSTATTGNVKIGDGFGLITGSGSKNLVTNSDLTSEIYQIYYSDSSNDRSFSFNMRPALYEARGSNSDGIIYQHKIGANNYSYTNQGDTGGVYFELSNLSNFRTLMYPDGDGTLALISDITTAVGAYVPLAGGVNMTGNFNLFADATSALQPVTYQQLQSFVVGLWDDRGVYDASTNTYPSSGGSGTAGAILKGDIWTISVAGVLGGVPVNISDTVRAMVDTPGSTPGNWAIGEGNLGYTPLSNVLNSTRIFVGNGSNVATGVNLTGDASISNAGLMTVTGLQTKALPVLATGNLRYNGTAWIFDSTSYAPASTTLAGYGITDAYTKTQADVIYATKATIGGTDTIASTYILGTASAQSTALRTNGVDRFTIDSSGNATLAGTTSIMNVPIIRILDTDGVTWRNAMLSTATGVLGIGTGFASNVLAVQTVCNANISGNTNSVMSIFSMYTSRSASGLSIAVRDNTTAALNIGGYNNGTSYITTTSNGASTSPTTIITCANTGAGGTGNINISTGLSPGGGARGGLKLGLDTAQPIGFWNATPIVQPTTAIAAATFAGTGVTPVMTTNTFDGYTIGQIVKALRNLGILA